MDFHNPLGVLKKIKQSLVTNPYLVIIRGFTSNFSCIIHSWLNGLDKP